MTSRGIVVGLALVPALCGLDAAGAPPPQAPPVSYVHYLDGKPFAEETAETIRQDGKTSVHGHITGSLPGGVSLTLDHVSTLSEDGARIVDYGVDILMAGRAIALRAAPSPKGWRLEAREGKGEPTVVEKEIVGTSFLMDNSMAYPIDLLVRNLSLEVGGSTTLSAVVPQAMTVVPLKVTRLPDGKAAVDGADVPVRHYRLEAASLLLDVTARGKDGALLEASIPMQKAAYRAKGYQPRAASAAAADPREAPTVVPSPVGDLPAVLTRPRSEVPVPAIVFLSGSGPNDRDETFGPNKPLADLARDLADRGIASLRFDKRTVVSKDPSLASTLEAEYVVDALRALEVLIASSGIDAGRIFVVGHSLGGSVAPLLAERSGKLRGVALLAPGVRRADDMVVDQLAFQLKIAGGAPAEIEAKRAEVRKTFQAIRDGSTDAPKYFLGAPPAYWRELLALDLVASLARLSIPVLVAQGEKDIQVRADLDFGVLRTKLGEQGGRIRYVLLPGLNHLFMKVEGESTGAEYAVEGHVDPAVADAIATWVRDVGAPRPEK